MAGKVPKQRNRGARVEFPLWLSQWVLVPLCQPTAHRLDSTGSGWSGLWLGGAACCYFNDVESAKGFKKAALHRRRLHCVRSFATHISSSSRPPPTRLILSGAPPLIRIVWIDHFITLPLLCGCSFSPPLPFLYLWAVFFYLSVLSFRFVCFDPRLPTRTFFIFLLWGRLSTGTLALAEAAQEEISFQALRVFIRKRER